jgi:DNA-binding response OmpR family regulator
MARRNEAYGRPCFDAKGPTAIAWMGPKACFSRSNFYADLPSKKMKSHSPLKTGSLVLDCETLCVVCGGINVRLPQKQAEFLAIFMQEPGRIFSREELCKLVWNRDHVYDSRTVEIFIMRLRKRLAVFGKRPYIETVRGTAIFYDLKMSSASSAACRTAHRILISLPNLGRGTVLPESENHKKA